MPKETIATRSENDTALDGTVLETRHEALSVAWGRQPDADGEAVQITISQETVGRGGGELYSAGLDRTEIDHLIDTLKRVKRQAYPHRAPCIDGSVCGGPHCPPKDRSLTPAQVA